MKNVWIFDLPAWFAGTQKPRMAFIAYIPVAWIPAQIRLERICINPKGTGQESLE